MNQTKILRLNKDLKFIISNVMRELKDPRVGGMISVVRTDLSNDMSYCKVYISSLEGEDAAKRAVKGLESAKGYIKRELSSKLAMRKCPDLKFIADNSIEHSEFINDTLKKVINPDKDENSDE